MANINSNPSHRANLGKNGFDVGKNSFFTSAPGMLLPTYWDFLSPGDKVKYSVDMFTRTETLLAPPFMKLRQVVRWFFVPIEQLFTPFGSMIYGIDDINTTLISSGTSVTDYIPTVKLDDLGAAIASYTPGTNTDAFGYDVLLGADRLCEFFHYGFHVSNLSSLTNLYRLNPLLPCAYQKIYFDKFRLSNRQANDRYAYNIDNCYTTGDVGVSNFFRNTLQIRYAHYDKDYFVNNEVSPLVEGGSIGMLNSASLSAVNDWLSPALNSSLAASPIILGEKSVGGTSSNPSGSPTYAGIAAGFKDIVSTSNIRSMFAVEKLAEITRRAAKHYDAQTLAHFGYDVPQGISGEVYELGAFVNNIQVSDVAATADSGVSVVGDLSGRGNGFSSGTGNSFTAPCHGILMAISYTIPDTTYSAIGLLARENTYRTRSDFYQPEFDRLGMQPMFAYESSFDPNAPAITNNAINGWHYRYQELKQKPNVSYGDFNQTRYPWVAKRTQNPQNTNLSQYLVSPNYLDSQVTNIFDGTFPYDPLMSWHDYKVYKSSVMSTYGLPSL